MLELNPGDEYEIKLGKKQIRLVPVGSAEEEELVSTSTQPQALLKGVPF